MPDWIGTFQNRARHDCSKQRQYCIDTTRQGFSLDRLHMGGICPPYGGDKCREDKALMGVREIHEGGHRPYGGEEPTFDRLYHKLNVLLMLSCNYTMQFIGYDSIKTR